MDLNCRSACSAVLSRSMGRLAEFHQRLSPSVNIWTWCQRRKNFSQAALDFVVLNAQRLRYLEVISPKNNFGIPNALSQLETGTNTAHKEERKCCDTRMRLQKQSSSPSAVC